MMMMTTTTTMAKIIIIIIIIDQGKTESGGETLEVHSSQSEKKNG